MKFKHPVPNEELELLASFAKPIHCSCDRCIHMCEVYPCHGTPLEIKNLLLAKPQFAHRLMSITDEEVPIIMPAYSGYEGTIRSVNYSYDEWRGDCAFLSNGKCLIHSLKPIIGRTAIHVGHADRIRYHTLPRQKIRELWQTHYAQEVFSYWLKLLEVK